MADVDGFLLPVPKRKVKAYLEISRKAGKVWKEHGVADGRAGSVTDRSPRPFVGVRVPLR